VGGWIRFYRKIWDSWLWKDDPLHLKWWLDLLLLANHQPNKIRMGGKLVTIDTGEHHTSIGNLAVRWNADPKTVTKFLEFLEADKMIIAKKSKQNGTTVKVLNYKHYQGILGNGMENETENGVENESGTKAERYGDKQELKNDNNKDIKNSTSAEPPQTQKKKSPSVEFQPDSVEYKATQYLIDAILTKNINARVPTKPDQIQKWCDAANKILRIDGKPEDEFKRVLAFAAKDPFWSQNILSMAKFREKYDQLYAKMTAAKAPQQSKFSKTLDSIKEWANSD
jgi:hypothetical protein